MALRAAALGCVLAGVLGGSAPARAEGGPSNARCASAYVDGQRALRERRLQHARDEFLLCAREPCPAAFRPECAAWLGEAQAAMPSVVVVARTSSGEERRDARVSIDQDLFADWLDGTAKELDPGDHTIRVELPDEPAIERRILVREGEKARVVSFVLASPPAASTSAPDRRGRRAEPSAPVWLFGSLTVVSGAAFAYFGMRGMGIRSDLALCKGACAQSRIDSGNLCWLLADVALGAGIVSLGATVWFALHPPASTRSVSSSGVHVELGAPGANVGGASVQGRF